MARSANRKSPPKKRAKSSRGADSEDILKRLEKVRKAISKIRPKLAGGSIADQLRFAELNQQLWSLLTERAIYIDLNPELASVCTLREIEHSKAIARFSKLQKVDLLRELEARAERQDDARARFDKLKAAHEAAAAH